MKKKIFVAVMAVVAGLVVLTGCQKEKPYAVYQVGLKYQGLPTQPEKDKRPDGSLRPYDEWVESLPADQKDLCVVADYLAGWLVRHGYIMTKNNNNPIVIEGDNLSLSDQQSYALYKNMITDLDKVDLNEVIKNAQTTPEFGEKLELTTSWALSFEYFITGITTLPSTDVTTKGYLVSYGPLTSNPE